MTQLRKLVQPARKPNAVGVHSLDHFSLHVPSLEVASRFYTAFGLDVRAQDNGLAIGAADAGKPAMWLAEGPKKALSYLSFGIFADDAAAFKQRLQSAEVAQIDPPHPASTGIWFRDGDGLLIELKIAEQQPHPATLPGPAAPVGVRTAPYRGEAASVRPQRMAHIMVFVRDVAKSIAFYSGVLGLRLSDEVEGNVAFMHSIHGSDHHVIAFIKSDAPGLHHCSWDVGAVNDIGLGAMQMADSGYAAGWGLGRFVLGSNYFHYIRDPWGSYCEYVSDLDYIPSDTEWEGRSHAAKKAFFLWGPAPPADFAKNYEIQA